MLKVLISELDVGKSLPSQQLEPVSKLDLIMYAGASGDYNPIHTIEEEAEKAGLPGIIAHGMWTMGNLSKIFTLYVNEGFVQKFSTRFSGMVFLNDVITLDAKLVDKKGKDLLFETRALNQDQSVVLKGNAVFRMH